jgi:geranylgeranylglyceryl phosphate synthase family protein
VSDLLQQLRAKGSGLLVLVDPERTAPEAAAQLARAAEEGGAAGLLIGTSFDGSKRTSQVAAAIKGACKLPLLLFPGSAGQLVPEVDAVLLLSLVSGRNAQYLIEEHVRSVPFFARTKVAAISTGYILVDGGRVTAVESVSQTRPLPADKPEIAAAHAIAAGMIGMAAVYLDSGSGALNPVAASLSKAVRASLTLPLIVGGGMRTPEQVREARAAGADFAVVGNAIETGGPGSVRAFVVAARA